MPQLTPCLWFDTEGEDAAELYTSVFPNSKILEVARYGSAGPRPEGTVMTVTFELDGQKFLALNGGPDFKFNEAVSFQIPCRDQDEVDHYWEKLGRGRRARAVRLAQGPLRPLLAGRAEPADGAARPIPTARRHSA